MSKPAFPVDKRFPRSAHVIFKGRGQGAALAVIPVLDDAGNAVARFRLSFLERLRVLLFGDIFVVQSTGYSVFQPIDIRAASPLNSPPESEGAHIEREGSGAEWEK